MDNLKRLKKGEILFRENEPIQMIYVVQSGKMALNIERGGKRLEIMTLGVSQVLGEQALFANSRQAFTAEALQETRLMEVPLDALKAQIASSPPGVKVMLKSLVDESKSTRQSLRSMKMETEKSPCPQPAIPRIFALLNLVARHTGKPNPEKPGEIVVDWGVLRLYATRMFAESPARIRSLVDLLLKINMVTVKVEKTEDGVEELSKVIIQNVQAIEDFAEFYQYNLYKGTYSEVIHVDTLALKVAKALAAISEGAELDRKGAVSILWDKVMDDMKKKHNIDLKGTHLDVLEKKGLFVKKVVPEKEPARLMFDQVEFVKTSGYWAIIHEIDKWNEKGFVDMNEKEATGPAAGEGGGCPSCQGAIDSSHKFCPHCGAKVGAAAA
jgi:hypothetical protein